LNQNHILEKRFRQYDEALAAIKPKQLAIETKPISFAFADRTCAGGDFIPPEPKQDN
jgi:hypothetical protein